MPAWLDIVLGLILLLSIVSGFSKGIARAGIGFIAVIIGLLAGLWSYGMVAQIVQPYVSSRPLANLIGFLAIFIIVIVLGSLLGALLDKLLKVVHLSWLNRLLGGLFGLVKGVLICGVVLLVIMAFTPKPPHSVARSHIAPYCIGATRMMAYAAPHEVREGFRLSYDRLKRLWEDMLKKHPSEPEKTDL